MKKSNTKIVISNDNLEIINEVGDEYGSLGMAAFKKIGKSIGDQLKIFKSFIKNSYNNTFGLARDIYVQTKAKGGLIKGLQSASQSLSQKNKQNLKDMDTIIAAQPGASDASTFLAMTAAPVAGFEGLVNTITGIEIKPSSDSDKYEKQKNKVNLAKSKAAYVNLVYAVYSLENKDLKAAIQNNRDFFSKINSEYFENDIFKGKKERELNLNSKAINVESFRKSKEFIRDIQVIYKISQLDNKLRTKYNIKSTKTLSINNEIKSILKLFIAKTSDSKIINYIANNQLSYVCINFADQIKQLKVRDRSARRDEVGANAFTHFKERLPESFLFSTEENIISSLRISKSLHLLKEVSEDDENKSDNIDLRFFALLHSAVYYIRLYYIEITKAYVELMIQHYAIKINKITMESSIKASDMSKEIEELKKSVMIIVNELKFLNAEILKFNQYYKEDLEKIDVSILKSITSFNGSGLKDAKKTLEKEKDENKKEAAKSEALLGMIAGVKKDMSGDTSIEDSKAFLTFYEKSIKERDSLLSKMSIDSNSIKENASNLNSYFNIDIVSMIEKTKIIRELSVEASAEIQKDFTAISEFTSKENEIKSIQANSEKSISSEEDSQDGQSVDSADFKKL